MNDCSFVAPAALAVLAACAIPATTAEAQIARDGDVLRIAARTDNDWSHVQSPWVRVRVNGDDEPAVLSGRHTLISTYVQGGDRVIEFVPGDKAVTLDLKPEGRYEIWVTGDLTGPSVVIGRQVESPRCAADWDRSGGVDIMDFGAFMRDWQRGDADIDRSGGTDAEDLVLFVRRFELGC